MEAIYSSKLFKTSPRKDALKAAIENPINTELVQQLRRYLDKEYLKPEYVLRESDQKKEKTPDEKGQTDVLFEGGPEFAPRSAPSMPSSLPDDSLEEEPLPDEEQTLDEETESEEPVAEESTSEEPVSESVKIQAMIGTTYLDDEPQISPDVIKGTLNNRTDCMGVSRVSIKNNELWIYYNCFGFN